MQLSALAAPAAGETLGLAASRAALQVDDLPLAEGQDLEAFVAAPVRAEPVGRADDHVVADAGELRLHLDAAVAALPDLEGQDLTGLVGAASRRRVLPPITPG